MARIRKRELYWDAPGDSDISGYAVYSGDPQNQQFLPEVDAGSVEPLREVTGTSLVLDEGDLPEGNYQFAVCSKDTAGNFSDPYQHPAWQNVPLDLTAPKPPAGGGLRII